MTSTSTNKAAHNIKEAFEQVMADNYRYSPGWKGCDTVKISKCKSGLCFCQSNGEQKSSGALTWISGDFLGENQVHFKQGKVLLPFAVVSYCKQKGRNQHALGSRWFDCASVCSYSTA